MKFVYLHYHERDGKRNIKRLNEYTRARSSCRKFSLLFFYDMAAGKPTTLVVGVVSNIFNISIL